MSALAEAPISREAATDELLNQFLQSRSPRLRDQVIERHEALVQSIARKFARPGVPQEDLVQTAWVALINALDRFDPTHNARFSTYAVHCMVGEIKRYFRDKTWAVRVPRHLQEIASSLHRVEDQLYRRLQRSPTMSEMAEACGISEEDLAQAMEISRCYVPQGLDDRREMGDGSDSMSIGEMVGRRDEDLENVVEQAPLTEALATLDERKRRVLQRRYFEGLSQQEVAAELGVSQMQISRLERAALAHLRERMAVCV